MDIRRDRFPVLSGSKMAIKDSTARRSRAKQDRKPVCYGYARVSLTDPHPARQRAALKAAGCEVIRAEKASGHRAAWAARVPARGRHAGGHPHRPAGALGEGPPGQRKHTAGAGGRLKATEQPVDTGTAAGKAFLGALAVLAEFETNLWKERQLEGIGRGQGARGLQGPAADHRPGRGAQAGGAGGRWFRDRPPAQDQPGQRLPAT